MRKTYLLLQINSFLPLKSSKAFRLLMMVFIFIGINTTVNAQSNIYESYAILNSNGGGNTYYDLKANTGNTDFNGTNLGTFNSGNSLILNGAQNKVYKCNTDDITNGKLYYRIYKTTDVEPSFLNSNMGFSSNDTGAGPGCQNQTWQSNSANINVLNGLCPGDYYLEIYTTADFTYNGVPGFGTHFANNGGNNYKASFTVVGTDTVAPVTPTLANITGQCTATATAPTTTDACSGTIIGTTSDALTYSTQGTHIIHWTFNDGNGQSIVVNQNVIIDDTTDPVIPTLANITGQCTATATAPTTTDACAGTIIGTTSDALTYSTQGTHIIHWTFNDGNGQSIVVNQNVIIDDTTDPVIPTLANITGQCTATATAPTTTDACAGTIIGTTSDALTYSTQGTHIIHWTFNDGNGQSIVVNQNVIIDDTTDPVIPTLANITGQCTATATAPTTTDACAGTIIGTTSDALTYSTQGTHIIHWTFNDGNGQSIVVNQNVIIDDTTDPVIPTLANITGQCTATATAPTTTDACAGTIIGTTSDALTYSTQGTHIIHWTFNDGNGQSIVVNQNVIIDDTTDPMIPTLADITGQCTATATAPTTTDACAGTIIGTTSDALTYSTQGTHIIHWTFNDGNGQSIVVNQNVIIDDTTDPVIPTLANITGQCTATATAPTTTDACAGTIIGTTSDALTYSTQGTHIIHWTFNDGNGQSIVVNQNVIIDDTTDPVIPTLANITGQCTATATAPTTTDACAGTIIGTTSDALTYSTQGTHIIHWTFNDGNGQSIVVNQNVIIDDTTDPMIPTLANITGQCTATATAPTTTDACAGTIIGTTSDALTYSTQGTHIIHWTFNDGNGQSIVVNQNVIIDDTTDPVIPTLANITGQCTATATAPTTTDACAGTIIGTTSDALTYSTQGTHIIHWTFNDGNGQSIVVNQNVIIDDTVAPVTPTLADVTGQCTATATAPTTTDACAGTIIGTTSDALTYSTQGTHIIHWTFNDGNGQSIVVNQNVIIDDTVAPVTPTLADITGQCTATATAPTTTDACAGTIIGTTSDALTYSTQGTHIIHWTFNDGNGQSIVVNQNVIIDDTVAPVTPTLANITGQCTATATAPTTTDACAGTIIGTTSDALTYSTQGTHIIHWTFNDGNGQSIVVNQNVIIDDTTDPVIPTLANITGQCTATATAPTTTDACAGTIIGTTSDALTYSTQGTHIIHWTFNDGNGQSIVVNQNVIIDDTVKPTLTAIADKNENIVTACNFTIPDYTSLATAADNCTAVGSISKTQSPASGTVISGNNATQLITITANDGNGNTETTSFTITLKDVTPPTITCPATATANTNNDGAGNCTTIVSLGTPTVSDNCTSVGNILKTAKVGGNTINPSTYLFGIGNTTVVWTATDQNGNVSIPCNQTVTVIDNENPTINCPANVQLVANAGCTATTVLVTPTAMDNCSVASVTNDAPIAFPLGNTTVTWTVTDTSGNKATCTQIVTVLDQTLPTAICKNISVNLNALGTASITAADINDNSTDNCGIASLVASKTSFDCTNLGANSVTLTVTDTSGNVSYCTATVTIVDVTLPVALCKSFTLNLNASGNATLLATDIDNGSSDNCSFTRTISKSSFNCSNIGTNTVQLTITDTSGNFTTCNATVTVVDPIAPVPQCKNVILNLDAAGNATLLATDIDNGSTDNCGIATRTVSPSSFTCANVGNNTVTLTVKDASNNTSTCTATVTIKDLIPPTAICKPVTIYLNSTGIATLTTADVNNGSSDNCGSVTLSLSKTSFDCSNRGTNTVTLTVTDTAGNASTCTSTVTVVDNIAPVATCKNFTLVLNGATGIGILNATDVNNGSSDNCGVVSYQISKDNSTFSNSLSYNCSDLGTKTVYLRVTDAAGNSNSCTAIVTVQTTLIISSVFLDVCAGRFNSNVTGGSGSYTYFWDLISSTAKPYRCGLFGASSNTASCATPYYNIFLANGIYTALLTVTDSNGCKATQTLTFDGGLFNGSTITTNSNTCVSQTITYTSSKISGGGITYAYEWTVSGGNVVGGGGATNNTVTVNWGTVGSGVVTVKNTPNILGGVCFSVDEFKVTVNPLPVPSFVSPITTVCPQSTQTYTLAANTFATRAWTVTGGTVTAGGDPADNSVTVLWGNGATGTVSVMVTNSVATGGCSAPASTSVNIVDTTPPTITTCPANVSVNANTGLCYATGVNLGTPVINDNDACGRASVSNNAPATFPIGNTTVTWTVKDHKNNMATCTQTVTVVDNQFPVISCQANVSLVSAAASCTASYDPTLPVYSDNCTLPANPLTWTMSGANTASGTGDIPNTAFNRGITIITYTVTDASLKTSSCSFTVTVTDNIPPTITCPSNINTTTNTACTATGVALGTPTTADNCSVVSVTNNAPVAFPIGTTTVTWTVTDVAGLTATCTQTVTVTDDDPPTISCPSNIATTTAVGVCTRLVNVPSPTTVDNCGTIAKLTWSMTGATTATSALTGINPIGNYTFNLGITTVQYTVTDSANNTANCSFTVTVNDNQPPVLSCPTNSTPLCADSTGKYTKTGTSWNATATDGCSTISSLTYTLTGSTTGSGTSLDGVAFNVGTTTVTWTATDTIGNTSNCTFAVNIIGLPSITTQPISQLDCEGSIVNFSVVATGTGLTYTWQRKLPTDASFITIPIESNVSYPSPGEIRLANVDSTLSPDGTQYQVIITNSSGCSITSAAATLSINKITTLLPIATAVTQCYGTNYSYTVSTSYPANVISYQWKSSVVSGVWNDVVNGTHFLGAQTETLQIINGTPAESAAYRVYITFDASGADCNVNSSSRSRSITFLPEVTAPVATIIQPSCTVATGSVVLSGLPASGTWTLTRTGTSSATTTGTGTSTTISGLATGTYNFTVFDGTCTSLPANVVINVQPGTPLVPTIDAYTLPSFADNDGTITLGNLPSGNWVGHQIKDGVTTTISGTGSPYTLTGLSNGSYEFEVVELCISPRSTPTPLTTVPYIPAVSPATNINCTGFTANWPATPTATAYLLDVSTDNFATFVSGYQNKNVGNVLTFPISGIPSGTYYYRIRAKNATLQSLYSATITVTPLMNTYSAGTWSLGTPPPTIGTQNLVFNASFTANADMAGCSCTVNTGNVKINSGKTLTIINGVTVNSPGTLTFEDKSSLVQINNVTNVGNITYKRKTTVITKMDFTYWSTPVLPFTLGGVSPNTLGDKFYSFDSSVAPEGDWKQESAATTMLPGVGYIIRGPQDYVPPMLPSLYEAPFVGIPNNGHYEITGIIPDRSYLLGNPYPSALDADKFLDDNQNVLDGTLYFWTHNTPIAIGTPDPGSGLYAYTGDDYAAYNRTGGVSTAEKAPSGIPGINNDNIPTGKIASGQGFFGGSKTIVAGFVSGIPIVYDNTMRVGVGGIIGDNSQFFKTKNTKTTAQLEKHRVWLDLINAEGAFKQTLVGYVTDATNNFEDRFDGESYDGNDFLDFYSVNQDKNLTIQGRALPFDANDEIPLGYRVALEGTFTIKIGKTDGMLSNQEIFIEDKLTNTVVNLVEENYTFATTAGTFDDRFVLKYTDKTLGVEDIETNDGIIALYSNNYKTLIIRNNLKDTTVNSVTLYNITGQKIANWEVKGREQTSIQIPIKNLPAEIYIVKIETTQGEFSKKIIVK